MTDGTEAIDHATILALAHRAHDADVLPELLDARGERAGDDLVLRLTFAAPVERTPDVEEAISEIETEVLADLDWAPASVRTGWTGAARA